MPVLLLPTTWPILAQRGMTSGQMLLIAVIAAATALSLISYHRRRLERGPSPRAYTREQRSHLKEEQAMKSDLGELLLEIQRVAREVSAQLDAKFLKLERSTREADQRIDRLDRLIRRADGQDGLDVLVADDAGAARVEPHRPTPPSAARGDVHRLADRGRSVDEIAEEVGMNPGEVELILGLRDLAVQTPAKPSP